MDIVNTQFEYAIATLGTFCFVFKSEGEAASRERRGWREGEGGRGPLLHVLSSHSNLIFQFSVKSGTFRFAI